MAGFAKEIENRRSNSEAIADTCPKIKRGTLLTTAFVFKKEAIILLKYGTTKKLRSKGKRMGLDQIRTVKKLVFKKLKDKK